MNIKDIDFKKYKRFFAFGCSFTEYSWPTWADMLAKEMPQVEFFNAGHCGSGNLMITNRIAEAHSRFQFSKDDLVVVMWTTFCREDRYFHNGWHCPGNIYTQELYDEKFVEKFADPLGYLIRDLGLITIATGFLKSLPCDTITLTSVPYNYQTEDIPEASKILDLYKDTIKLTPPSLFELEMNGIWDNGHTYHHSIMGSFGDYHPNPVRYKNYLEKLGFPLTEKSINFANVSLTKLRSCKTDMQILKTFENDKQYHTRFKGWT